MEYVRLILSIPYSFHESSTNSRQITIFLLSTLLSPGRLVRPLSKASQSLTDHLLYRLVSFGRLSILCGSMAANFPIPLSSRQETTRYGNTTLEASSGSNIQTQRHRLAINQRMLDNRCSALPKALVSPSAH